MRHQHRQGAVRLISHRPLCRTAGERLWSLLPSEGVDLLLLQCVDLLLLIEPLVYLGEALIHRRLECSECRTNLRARPVPLRLTLLGRSGHLCGELVHLLAQHHLVRADLVVLNDGGATESATEKHPASEEGGE